MDHFSYMKGREEAWKIADSEIALLNSELNYHKATVERLRGENELLKQEKIELKKIIYELKEMVIEGWAA